MSLNRLWFGSDWGPQTQADGSVKKGLNRLWFGSDWGPSAARMDRAVGIVSIAFGSALIGVLNRPRSIIRFE